MSDASTVTPESSSEDSYTTDDDSVTSEPKSVRNSKNTKNGNVCKGNNNIGIKKCKSFIEAPTTE